VFRGVICPVSIIEGVKCPVFKFRGVIRPTTIVQGVIRTFSYFKTQYNPDASIINYVHIYPYKYVYTLYSC
jgi:hypothetical protein